MFATRTPVTAAFLAVLAAVYGADAARRPHAEPARGAPPVPTAMADETMRVRLWRKG